MTWRVKKVEDLRKEIIDKVQSGQETVAELCREFTISRKTIYKWLQRYEKEGPDGLINRNKAPNKQYQRTSEEIINYITSLKQEEPKLGPKKIRAVLERDWPLIKFPSITTVGNILKERGLTIPRKYRKRYPKKSDPLSHCKKPNDLWSIDFKGWFKTKDKIKFEPLTLTDAYSRYILRCNKLGVNSAEYVWDILSKAFQEYGLPIYLRHDNGPPFGTCGAGRLSRLSVNLIKAGVIPEWIEPGKPEQNGRHERMHLTLKQEAIFPLELTFAEQKLKFAEFLKYFNEYRPHEALGQKTPASVYKPSERRWNGKLKPPEYSLEYQVVRIRGAGQLAWHGTDIYIGKTLANEYIGIKENDDGELSVYFGPVFLGTINYEKKFIQPQRKLRQKGNYKQKVY